MRTWQHRILRPASLPAALAAIMTIALALRLWGVWNVSTTDEYNEVLEALRVCSGHLNFERWVKRFYLYILSFEYGIYYIFGWLFQAFSSPMDFAEKIIRDMSPLFILGRVTSALAGALTVAVLFKAADRFYNRTTAVIASLLLTFTVFHIDLSQQAKVDALLGLMVATSLYFLLTILEDDEAGKWDYGWCGLFMALAMQTKINAVVLFVPLALVAFFKLKDDRSLPKHAVFFFPIFFLVGFIIGNPPVLLAPFKFVTSVLGLSGVYTRAINEVPSELIGFLAYPLYFTRAMGIVTSVVAALSLVAAFINPNKKRIVLISFLVPFYLLMGASKNMVADYYILPAMPFLYLLMGDILDQFMEKTIPARKKAAISVLMCMMLIIPLIKVAKHEISLTGKNTRILAQEWIEQNIPNNSKILMDSGKSINSFAPTIAENLTSMNRILSHSRENVRQGKIVHGMVDKNALIYYELLAKSVPDIAYDLTSTMFGLAVESVDHYIANQYDYFIIAGDMKRARSGEFFAANNPSVAQFYRSLDTDPRLTRIKTIGPTTINRGDTYYIYKLAHTNPAAD